MRSICLLIVSRVWETPNSVMVTVSEVEVPLVDPWAIPTPTFAPMVGKNGMSFDSGFVPNTPTLRFLVHVVLSCSPQLFCLWANGLSAV